jgi:release factor glutamine methyltransferase
MIDEDYDLSIRQYLEDGTPSCAASATARAWRPNCCMGLVLRKPRSYLHAWPEQQLGRVQAAELRALCCGAASRASRSPT